MTKRPPASTRRPSMMPHPKSNQGPHSRRVQATKGTFGPASRGRVLSAEERAAVERQMQERK